MKRHIQTDLWTRRNENKSNKTTSVLISVCWCPSWSHRSTDHSFLNTNVHYWVELIILRVIYNWQNPDGTLNHQLAYPVETSYSQWIPVGVATKVVQLHAGKHECRKQEFKCHNPAQFIQKILEKQRFWLQMGLDPTIPGIGGQCRIHLATGASDWSLLTK